MLLNCYISSEKQVIFMFFLEFCFIQSKTDVLSFTNAYQSKSLRVYYSKNKSSFYIKVRNFFSLGKNNGTFIKYFRLSWNGFYKYLLYI